MGSGVLRERHRPETARWSFAGQFFFGLRVVGFGLWVGQGRPTPLPSANSISSTRNPPPATHNLQDPLPQIFVLGDRFQSLADHLRIDDDA